VKLRNHFLPLVCFLAAPCHGAVLLTEWHDTFNAYGVRGTTHTITIDPAGLVREDWSTMEPAQFDATIVTQIRRPDLGKLWVIRPDKKKYVEWALPPTASTASVSISSDTQPMEAFEGVSISSQVTGPGQTETVQGFEAKPYIISLTMGVLDPKSGKEIRRYEYHEKVWLSQEVNLSQFRTNWEREVAGRTLQARDAIERLHANKSKSWLTRDIYAPYYYEQAVFGLEQVKLYQQLPGVPIRRITVSASLIPGKERSFRDQETIAATNGDVDPVAGYSPLALGISTGINVLMGGLKRLTAPHREIPTWVLDVDPAFPNHGGTADRIELLSMQNVPPNNAFELPEKFKKVSHF